MASSDLADDDGDGLLGIAATPLASGGDTLPPAAAVGDDGGPPPLARSLEMAFRVALAMGGKLTSCSTVGGGAAVVTALNMHVVGCTLTDATACSATQVGYVDSEIPALTTTPPASASSVVIATDGAAPSCADVLAALP
jgi:hypothetical protein